MEAEQKARKQEQKGTRRQKRHEVDQKKETNWVFLIHISVKNHLSVLGPLGATSAEIFNASVGARLAQSVERKALNLVVWARAPSVGVAAEPTQSLSSVNLQQCTHQKNAGTADWSC